MTEPTEPAALAPPAALEGVRIPAWRKALYAMEGVGTNMLDYIVAVYLLKYYTDHPGLSAGLAGLALFLGKAFDAVSDPVMGFISDRTQTRWGRRRPWFVVGMIPFALSFIAMFNAPQGWPQAGICLWLIGWNVVYYFGYTIIEVPHAALGGEMAQAYSERTSVMGWRMAFSNLGLFVGAAAPLLVLAPAEDRAAEAAKAQGLAEQAIAGAVHAAAGAAHGRMAVLFGLVSMIVIVITFLGTREDIGRRPPPRDTIFGNFGDAAKSRPFQLFSGIFIIEQIAVGLTATLLLYAINDWWGFGREYETPLIVAYLGSAILSIPLWITLGRRYEKVHLFMVGAAIGMLALFALVLVPRLGLVYCYAILIGAGIGFGARIVMSMAIVPDIIDDDELRTRTRKDGAYFGVWNLSKKTGRAAAMGLSGVGIGLFGYQTGAIEQPESAIRGIMWMFAIIPGICLGLCGLAFLWFPLNRATHAGTLDELERRRAELA